MSDLSNPKHFRNLRTTTDLASISTIDLDDIACQLIKEIDNLETYGRDINGQWYSKTDKHSYEKWQKYLNAIEKILESRPDAN